jgi:hypothetical protein
LQLIVSSHSAKEELIHETIVLSSAMGDILAHARAGSTGANCGASVRKH